LGASPSAWRAAGGSVSPSAKDSNVDVALGVLLPPAHSLNRPLGDPGHLRDLPLRHPVRAKDHDDLPQIPPTTRSQHLQPRENTVNDLSHPRFIQSHSCSPSLPSPSLYLSLPGQAAESTVGLASDGHGKGRWIPATTLSGLCG
jgi:hypothetical protein